LIHAVGVQVPGIGRVLEKILREALGCSSVGDVCVRLTPLVSILLLCFEMTLLLQLQQARGNTRAVLAGVSILPN